MTVKVTPDAEIMREAAEILLQHMTPSKAVRFWAMWQRGDGNYLAWRDEEFANESVEDRYGKAFAFQDNSPS